MSRHAELSPTAATAYTTVIDRLQVLRQQAALDLTPDLSDLLEAASILTRSLPTAEASDQHDILRVLSALTELVEESLCSRASRSGEQTADSREQKLIKDMLLAEIMMQLGIVDEERVETALELQHESGMRIGECLVELGAATPEQVADSLRVQNQLRRDSGVPGDLFGAIVPHHSLWEHPFLQRCRARQLSAVDVRTLAVQMYKFCREFSRILASTFVCCPDEYARVVIADNLFDETGQGDESHTHPELFRRFTRALGVSDEELEALPVEPETEYLINTYLRFPERHGYLAALGAVCYASENIVSTLYTQLLAGIENGVTIPDDALEFFRAHVELDEGHAHALINVVNRGAKSFDDARLIVLAINEALSARERFFDGIERCSGQADRATQRCAADADSPRAL